MQSTEDISAANEKRKPIITDNRETKALKIMMSDDKVTAKNELMETSLQQINDEDDDQPKRQLRKSNRRIIQSSKTNPVYN
jgi:hypothetical protein